MGDTRFGAVSHSIGDGIPLLCGARTMAFDSELLKRLRLGVSDDRKHLVIRSAAGRGEIIEYSFGIEEEYFLADKRTLDVAMETPNELFEAANWSPGGEGMRGWPQWQT